MLTHVTVVQSHKDLLKRIGNGVIAQLIAYNILKIALNKAKIMIKIENCLCNRFYVYYTNRVINKLFKYIPQNHLLGLEKIVISDFLSGNYKNSAALYWRKNDSSPALIEISFYAVFHKKPIVLMLLPFVGKFLLASVLYHEIGHHYHHSLKHGVRKNKSEIFAENYKKEMLKKAFWSWRIFLSPLAPFAKFMANRHNN